MRLHFALVAARLNSIVRFQEVAITDILLRTAYEDTQLLRKNDAHGDVFSVPRDVDFFLVAEDKEKAELVSSFINDNQYGTARVDEGDGTYNVLVVVHMPTEQNILCSVSALMACVAAIFGIKYDGWGCVIQTKT
jgi:hypothetical protein